MTAPLPALRSGAFKARRIRESIFKISKAVSMAESLDDLCREIHGIVAGLMPAENFYIALLDREKNQLRFPYFIDSEDDVPETATPGRGLTEYVLRTGTPLLATPEVFDRLVEEGEVEILGPDSLDWLGVPLKARGETYGTLVVQSYTTDVRYSEDDRDLLVFVADQVGHVVERMRADEAIRKAQAELKRLTDHMIDAISQTDMSGVFQFASPSHRDRMGWTPEELHGRPFFEFVHPDDREALTLRLAETAEKGGTLPLVYRFAHKNEGHLWVETIANLLRDGEEKPQGWVLVTRDVTERKEAELVLSLVHEVDRKILGREPFDSILDFVCTEIVARLGFRLAWVGFKQPDGNVQPGASAGPASGYLDGFEVRWDRGPLAQGPTGKSIQTGKVHTVNSQDDESWEPWRARAKDFGLESSASFPLVSLGVVRGALAIYSGREGTFDTRMLNLLRRFADQLAFSLMEAEHLELIELQTAALEAAANAVVITNRDGKVEWVNPAFTQLTGYELSEILGETPRVLKSGIQSDHYYQRLWETISEGQVWRGELYNRRKDGSIYVEEQTITPVRGADGQIRHFVAIKQDVTTRRKDEERIRYLALHDPLTELPNRRALEERLERMISECSRGSRSGILMLIDLDNFKIINDTLGHPAGDRILVEFTRLLRSVLRPGDQLGRLGGDEFVVLLEGSGPEAGRATGERLRQAVDAHRFRVEGRIYDLTISVGMVPIDGRMDSSSILSLADSALYISKDRGRNQVTFLEATVSTVSSLALAGEWAGRIKSAIKENRLVLMFQPILRLADSRVLHYEALLRMREEEGGGLIGPGSFLGAGERFGLMPQIDRWVVREVLSILKSRPALEIFVNVSGASLGQEPLLTEIEALVRESGVKPGQLAFEITETAAVADVVAVRQWMRRLKELGCRFALDDFGMGFSSFSYLQSLPADYVKIDGAFIRDLSSNPANRALVKAIDTVAETMGKETIAESVEDARIIPVLRELGVEFGQGFALGMPALGIPQSSE
ncbi:MAG: EAL domain-containing protein [Thermoanaerobaculia bacterium]|nr:EAL domain-containing protein [Thermoanaerobaculia bacterium]